MIVDRFLSGADKASRDARVSDPLRSISHHDLLRLANVMRRQVLRHTDNPNVGIYMPSCVAFAGTFYGILWAGRTVVPLNFLLGPAELAAVVADSGLDTIFSIKHFAEQLAPLPVKKIFVEDLPLKREMIFERLRIKPSPPRVRPEDTAILLYTSGTSGMPKGVCQTHANLVHNAESSVAKARLEAGHRFLGVLPLFHSFGITAMMLVPTWIGADVHYLPRFTPASLFDTIRERRSSVTMLIASMYGAMLKSKRGKAEDLVSVTYAVSGGEALPPQVHAEFLDRFKVDLLQGYGMTESSPVVSLNVPWDHRTGTVGQAISGLEVRAFDDNNAALPAGRDGELWVRGPSVMKGYYKKPDETAAAITPDGWYKTGDMGNLDADGFITITGRKKEMIIVGGENVYPREIENALEQHAAVAESAVIGKQDASRGEVVVAFVTLREGAAATETDLREHCRERLAGYKVPRQVIIAADLPRGPTGKILKRKLKENLPA